MTGQMLEETVKRQKLVDALLLVLDEAHPLPIFQVNYVVLLQSWKANLQSLSSLAPFMPLMGSELLLKLGTIKWLSSPFVYSVPFDPSLTFHPITVEATRFIFGICNRFQLFPSGKVNISKYYPFLATRAVRRALDFLSRGRLDPCLCRCVALDKSLYLLFPRIL